MKDALPDIIDNYQWLHAPGPGLGWHVWVGLLAGLILLAGTAWYFIRRKKSGRLSFAPSPHHVALRALNELGKKLSEDHQLEFVVEVSQIARVYIQARFGLRAPHRSTEEFLRELHVGEPLLQDHQELLGDFLTRCDLVKFAQRHVVLEQMNGLLDNARRFVESTAPVAQPQPSTGKAR